MPVPYCSSYAGVRDADAEMHVQPYPGSRMPVPYFSCHAGVRDAGASTPSSYSDAGVRDSVAEMPLHTYSGAWMPVPFSHSHASVRDPGYIPSCHSGVWTSGAGIRSTADG